MRALAAPALVLALQPGVWSRLPSGYAGDDFWNLGALGCAGLAALSLAIWMAICFGAERLSGVIASRPWSPLIRAGVDVGVKAEGFAALLTAAPQLYYVYYQLVIPGLPTQWVVQAPDLAPLWRAVSFAPEALLAEHWIGAVFWGLTLLAVLRQAGRGAAAAGLIALPLLAALSRL